VELLVAHSLNRTAFALEDDPESPPLRRESAELREEQVFALIYGQMCSLAGRCPDLDDLVQIAAERVFRSLSSFAGRSELSTWTYRICYRTLLNERRWHRRWLRRFTLGAGELEDAPEPNAGPDLGLEQRERASRLHAALGRVSARRRVVVILHDLEGLELETIAGIVEAKLNTVRSRLRDGRKLLLQELRNDPYFSVTDAGEAT
jgi:RNA polymerase sigma-70 factor (ECF subfamily)